MTACFYIKQRKGEAHPQEVLRELKQKRFVVSSAVARYEVVQEFHRHVVLTHGNGGKATKGGKSKKAKAT
jgi:hypothetical protein